MDSLHLCDMRTDKESIFLQQLGQGDHAAFEQLFLSYQPKVKAFLMGFLKDEEEVSDMVQDLFFKIWVNRETISQVTSFKAYLFRMARNMIYDHFEHSLVKESYEKKQQNKPDYTDLVENDLYVKELELLIDIDIQQMPEQRKRVFTMSRKEGMTNDEIANQLQLSKRTVENHITQALADLRKALKNVYLLLM